MPALHQAAVVGERRDSDQRSDRSAVELPELRQQAF